MNLTAPAIVPVAKLVLILPAFFIVGASAQAKAFGLGADFGYKRLLIPQDPDLNGYGGDVYVRPLALILVEPELQLGRRHSPTKIIGTVGYWYDLYPLMVGARVSLPVVPIFLGAHLGAVCTRFRFAGCPAEPSAPAAVTKWNFGFNVGGGYTFLDVASITLGISAWYYVVPASDSSGAKSQMLTVNLDLGWRL